MHEADPGRLILVELKSKIRFPEVPGRVHFRSRGAKPILNIIFVTDWLNPSP